VPATYLDTRNFYTRTPPWIALTALVGLLLFVILVLTFRTTVNGALPACGTCAQDRQRFLLWVKVGWLGTVVVFVAAIFTGSGALVLLAVLLAIAATVWSCCAHRFRVSGVVSKDKLWVELKGVGPEFARTIEEGLRPQQPLARPHADLPAVPAAYLGRQWGAPAQVAPQVTQAPPASAPPQLSPDGHWWWDGTQWVPATATLSQG
jgi:hypothetical protein